MASAASRVLAAATKRPLWQKPAPFTPHADEIGVNEALLASGAPISAMNTIRKHISTIKGGRLAAAAHPAMVVSFIVSDIPGDNPALVASGPTVPDVGSREDALALIATYRTSLPDAVMAHLKSSAADGLEPGEPRFARNEVHVVASAAVSLEAAADEARRQGIDAVILSDSIEGESRDVASMHAAIAREIATRDRPFTRPVLLLSGGETTVTLRAKSKGGRNSEFLLSFALGINGIAGIDAIAADTDGIDGSEDNAGAFAGGQTVERMRQAGVDAKSMLMHNNAWTAFRAIDDLLVTGPTGTFSLRASRAGVPVECHVYPGAIHGFDLMGDTTLGRRVRFDRHAALSRWNTRFG